MKYCFGLLSFVGLAFSKTTHKDDGKTFTNAPAAIAGRSSVRRLSSRHKSLLATGGLSEDQNKALLAKHNALRAAQSQPCTASDMTKLEWDDTLAAESQAYSTQCFWGHDPRNQGRGWGENLAMRWSSAGQSFSTEMLVGFTQSWYDEIADTQWSSAVSPLYNTEWSSADPPGLSSKVYANPKEDCQSYDAGAGNCMIGHYTALIWAKTTHVGCGVSVCDSGLGGRGGVILVCKYSPPGNYQTATGETMAPYRCGASCGGCSDCIDSKLCKAGSVCMDQIGSASLGDLKATITTITKTDRGSMTSTSSRTSSQCSSILDFKEDYCDEDRGLDTPYCEYSCGRCGSGSATTVSPPAGVSPPTGVSPPNGVSPEAAPPTPKAAESGSVGISSGLVGHVLVAFAGLCIAL